MPYPPDCSIDFNRRFSLLFGVPPKELPDGQFAVYMQGLGCRAEVFYHNQAGGKDFDPFYWDGNAVNDDKVRFLTLSASGQTFVLPRASSVLNASFQEVTLADYNNRVSAWNQAAPLNPGDSVDLVWQKTSAKLLWNDKIRRQEGYLPMPALANDSGLLFWPKGNPAPAPSGMSFQGLLNPDLSLNNNPNPTHLLNTPAGSWTGEFNPTLLRAPAFGRVRYQRYRHAVDTGTKFNLIHPSAAGRLIITIPPKTLAVPAGDIQPTEGEICLVMENVLFESVRDFLGALLVYQASHFNDLSLAPRLSAEKEPQKWLLIQFRYLLHYWVVYAERVNPQLGITHADYNPFRPVQDPGKKGPDWDQTKNALARACTPAQSSEFYDFIRNVYSSVLAGGPVTHAALAPLAMLGLGERQIVCFAGCPLGKAAPVYMRNLPPTLNNLTPTAVAAGGFDTYDMEAMYIAGTAAAAFGINPTIPVPETYKPLVLDDFIAKQVGNLAYLRCSEPRSPLPGYGKILGMTAKEWLAATLRGISLKRFTAPELDISRIDQPNPPHPLLAAVELALHKAGAQKRGVLNTAADANVGPGRPLAKQNLDWWKTRSGTYQAANDSWPAWLTDPHPLTGSFYWAPPTPRFPYARTFEPVNPGEDPCQAAFQFTGFDCEDLAAITKVTQCVRNGRTFSPIHPAVVMALLDREGYRQDSAMQRTGIWLRMRTQKAFVPGFQNACSFKRMQVRAKNLVFPYGLDFMNYKVGAPSTIPAVGDTQAYINYINDQFSGVLDKLVESHGAPNQTILDKTLLPTDGVRDYLEEALESSWRPDEFLQYQILSRRTQWVLMALQAACFEYFHRLLYRKEANDLAGTNAPPAIDEFDDNLSPMPTPGATANSRERRDFIAYYSLVYLAFNTGANSWSRWVNTANRNNNNDFRHLNDSVGCFLTYYNNTVLPNLVPSIGNQIWPGNVERDDKARGQRGNMHRFAAALDAYLRLDFNNNAIDTSDPALRNADPVWRLTRG